MKLDYCKGKYNPFEINEIIFKKESGYKKLIPDSFRKTGVFVVIIRTLYITLRSFLSGIFSILKNNLKDMFDNKCLFVIPTVNNQRALQKVIDIVQYKKDNVRVAIKDFGFGLYVALMSLPYLPILWYKYTKLTIEEKRLVSYYLENFVFASGFVEFYFRILQKYKPECVVFANDHIYMTKSLELVCEDLKIQTIYVQHASVSYAFPELHFAYSFLDGKDSLLKYTSFGKKSIGNIIILGAARYDGLSSYRNNRNPHNRNCIGVAINLLDDNDIVNDFCKDVLLTHPNLKIKIRSHPALKDKPFKFDDDERIIYTCATDEPMTDYLDSIDFQVSGDSCVHFDAIIGGVNTIVYNLSKKCFSDNYQYVKSGFIKFAENIEQVFEFANCHPDISLVRFYDESYQKTYSGKCSDIIAEFIIKGYNLEILKKYDLEIFKQGYTQNSF